MKITRKLLREYIQKLIKEGIVLPQTVNIRGKQFIIVNSLTHTAQMVELLLQAQSGGSAGFGNYFEDVVLETFTNEYTELNDGAGGPFPFADIYKELLGGLAFYSVKMKRILYDSNIGGGTIAPNQLRSMLQHPTTVSEFKGVDIRPGLIGGALEPDFFNDVKNMGLPIKIQIINPTTESPIFRLEEDLDAVSEPKAKNNGILCVKSKTEEYAQKVFGTGISNPYYKFSTLTLSDDGFYRINGNDNIFKNDPEDPRITQDPTALSMLSNLVPYLKKLGFNDLQDYIDNYVTISKSKRDKMSANDESTYLIADTLYKAYIRAKNAAQKIIEDPTKPITTATGTYELFDRNIMEETGSFADPIYLLLTGGYPDAQSIMDVLSGDEPALPNTKVLIDKIKKILSFQAADIKDKGKPIASRIISAFSRKQLITKVKEIDKENFPNGFFIAFNPSNQLIYSLPDSIDFPFEKIGSKDLIKKLKRYAKNLADGKVENIPEYDSILQGIKAEDLPSVIPSYPKKVIDPDLANKVLVKIAIEIYIGEIETFEIPFKDPDSVHVQEFKKACREFSLLKKLSDDSQSSSLFTEAECAEIEQNIKNFRRTQVMPLAIKVLPPSMVYKGEKLTRVKILKRLGLNESILREQPMLFGMPEESIDSFEDYDFPSQVEVDPVQDLNTAKIETVLSTIFEMADLLTLILQIAKREPRAVTNMLTSFLNESEFKIYQKILSELLKRSTK